MYILLFNHFHSRREQCRLVSKVVLTFETMWMKSCGMTIQVKPQSSAVLSQRFHWLFHILQNEIAATSRHYLFSWIKSFFNSVILNRSQFTVQNESHNVNFACASYPEIFVSIYLNVVFKRLVKMSKCVPFAFFSLHVVISVRIFALANTTVKSA